METKVSKSQIEVWEWKESLFEDLKNIPKDERLKFIKKKVKKTIDKLNQFHSTSRVA
jgi:vacuolar-type H+-ATPase subunit E/Vma4